MQGIIPGHKGDMENANRRLYDIERALGTFQNFLANVDVFGVGPCRMEIIGKLNSKIDAYDTQGCPFRAFVNDAKNDNFCVGTGALITNVATGEEKEVTGLNQNLDITKSTKVWIECSISAEMTCSSAKIAHGDAWPADMVVFQEEDTGKFIQTQAYVCVGEFLPDDAAPGEAGFNINGYHFSQKLTTNLFLALMVIDGKAAVYPLPFAG